MAYCVDGGLLYGHFTIADIVQHYMAIENQNDREEILKVINQLLYVCKENDEF